MRRTIFSSLLVIGSLLTATSGLAQSADKVPEEMPYDIPYGPSITLEQAQTVMHAAMAESKKHNWKHAICIVDPAGLIVLFAKMDNTQLASIDIAEAKAFTAARMRRPTKVIEEGLDKGGYQTITLPGVIAVEGGVPLVVAGKIIGAVGASGGSGPQDDVVVQAGVDALK